MLKRALAVVVVLAGAIGGVHAQSAYQGGKGDGYASAKITGVTMGIGSKSEGTFALFPDPLMHGQLLNITIDNTVASAVLEVYDLSGKRHGEYIVRAGRNEIDLAIPKGTYLLCVRQQLGATWQRLVVI